MKAYHINPANPLTSDRLSSTGQRRTIPIVSAAREPPPNRLITEYHPP